MTLLAIWFAQNKNFTATKKIRGKIINELKMLSANIKCTLENINEKSLEIAKQVKGSRHMVFCGLGVSEVIAAEAALKTKELTYMHCQSFKLNEAGNNFFCFFKKYPGIPAVFIVLDYQKEKL